MHWDVVEVKPEPNHRLFVRFKDGLAGHVQLLRENLNGALEPLRDQEFFQQAFVDQGAVAWPGNIDLAPDSMYEEVKSEREHKRSPFRTVCTDEFREDLPRFCELYDLTADPN